MHEHIHSYIIKAVFKPGPALIFPLEFFHLLTLITLFEFHFEMTIFYFHCMSYSAYFLRFSNKYSKQCTFSRLEVVAFLVDLSYEANEFVIWYNEDIPLQYSFCVNKVNDSQIEFPYWKLRFVRRPKYEAYRGTCNYNFYKYLDLDKRDLSVGKIY